VANPAVTYTFANSTTADATQVNTNFTDIINALTDGTKSLTIDALTAGGTATFNGAVTLGNGTPDDITVSGSLASSIPIKTTNSYDIGSSTIGLAGIYFGSSGGAFTTRLKGAAVSSSYTFTLPTTGGTSGYVLQTDGSGTTSWVSKRNASDISNYSLSASVASNILTVALKDAAGSDPSSSSPVDIIFRSSTAATGTPVTRQVTAALSMTVPDTATLGHASNKDEFIYVYAIDNAGTVELAVSSYPRWDELSRITTSAVDTSADSKDAIYSSTSRTNVALRFLGRLKSNQATAGTWATTPSEVSLRHRDAFAPRHEVACRTGNGHGATNTKIRRFTTSSTKGSAITYADSANDGATFTINEDGVYAIAGVDGRTVAGNCYVGISLNSSQLTTNINSATDADTLMFSQMTSSDYGNYSCTAVLHSGDVVRVHTDGNADRTTGIRFRIVKVSN
jgi:hypothetical protein